MEYTIISESTQSSLCNKIAIYIKLGWRPQGGVAMSTSFGINDFYQAMIKD